ncbi:MAG TPA: outer membrane beta-barrel protein [Bryobacteraceae bacterium]|nr:outer membrane beta-barrel protein [Bryobacteraceae bacterium]
MKLFILLSFLLSCSLASAQSTRGYLFIAPGGLTASGNTLATYQLGGGVEQMLSHGVAAGAELSGVIPAHHLASNTAGIFSLNGYYHFLREGRLDPYATLGYSLLFRDFTANMFNYGAGANYWFHNDLALKLEVRDHVWGHGPAPAAHYWGIRIGVAFR